MRNSKRSATKHYRDLAGVRIQFYREEDREIVEKALVKLGFNIEARHGSAPLINRKASAIAYGNQVSDKDLRDIAGCKTPPVKRHPGESRGPVRHSSSSWMPAFAGMLFPLLLYPHPES